MNSYPPFIELGNYCVVLSGPYTGLIERRWVCERMKVDFCEADGRRLSMFDYPDLYALVGESHGPVIDGEFLIPNLLADVGGIRSVAMTTNDIDNHDHGMLSDDIPYHMHVWPYDIRRS